LLNGNVNGVNIYDSVQWAISDDCMKFRVGDSYWSKTSATVGFSQMTHASSFVNTRSEDPTFSYAVSGGDIYKYDTISQGYKFFASASINNECKLTVYQNRLFIDASNQTNAEVYAYALSATTATQVFNYSSQGFTLPPKVSTSPKLNNIFIVGPGANTTQAYAFQIDWTSQNASNITFPSTSLEFGLDCFISVGEEFFYIRQLRFDQNYSWIPAAISNLTLQESAYYLSQRSAMKIFLRDVASSSQFIWKFTAINSNTSG